MYATCAAILLQCRENRLLLEYSLAGHPPILRAALGSKHVEHLQDPQFPLGLIAEASFTSRELHVCSGDLFLIATDGIFETSDRQGNEFGFDRVETILVENITAPLSVIAGNLQAAVRSFGKQTDDQTIFLLRVTENIGRK